MNNRITVRIETDVDEALQRLIASELTTAKSKQDAFRYIVRDWLTHKGYLVKAAGAEATLMSSGRVEMQTAPATPNEAAAID